MIAMSESETEQTYAGSHATAPARILVEMEKNSLLVHLLALPAFFGRETLLDVQRNDVVAAAALCSFVHLIA